MTLNCPICMRDPGTFIPAAYGKSHGRSFKRFMAGATPAVVQWSGLIHRMRTVLPRAKITAWCNEDTPFIWPKILRHLIGLNAEDPVKAGYDLIGSLLTEIGAQKMQNYFKANPPNSRKRAPKGVGGFFRALCQSRGDGGGNYPFPAGRIICSAAYLTYMMKM